jgi:cytochrome oxidase assembly protein ShyY1
MKPNSRPESGAAVRCSAWLAINIVTLILIIIVAIGQWQIYPRLNATETNLESLAKQLSLQKSLPAPQSKMPESPSNVAGAISGDGVTPTQAASPSKSENE